MQDPRSPSVGDEPSVEAFMRHLQVCVEEARTIADPKEASSVFSNLSRLCRKPSFTKTELRNSIDMESAHPPGRGRILIDAAPAPKKVEALMTEKTGMRLQRSSRTRPGLLSRL